MNHIAIPRRVRQLETLYNHIYNMHTSKVFSDRMYLPKADIYNGLIQLKHI